MRVGAALRPLRDQKCLLIGSGERLHRVFLTLDVIPNNFNLDVGGAVHNLYRNAWAQALFYRDSYGQERPPEPWAIDFGNAFSDVVTKNSGHALRRGMARLMTHPLYRDAVRYQLERFGIMDG